MSQSAGKVNKTERYVGVHPKSLSHKSESAHNKMHLSKVIDFRRGAQCIRICIWGTSDWYCFDLQGALRSYRYRYRYGYLRRGRQRSVSVVDSCRRRIYVSGTKRSRNPNEARNRNRRVSNTVMG